MRDHARLTLLVGFVLLLAGAILPWMRVWLPYQGYVDVSGFERAGDAGLLVEFGLAGLALTWSEGAWHSRVTVLVAGPLTLALMGVLLLRVAHGDANIYLASLKQQGGTGSISPGFWTANVGAVVATIGGAVQLWRRRASLSFNVGLTRIAVAGSIGGVVGAIGGFLAGTEIAGRITTGAIVAVSSSVVVVLALLLAFVGCWIGAVGAARLARSLPRR
ncbi:MAG: hypothetical protein HYX54_01250 [Chloroflexi bacterium]|nr:hypothetical protein [Chloroflexota bacterium]